MNWEDLGKLPFDAVVALAHRMGTGSPADWGEAMNVSPHIANRWFSTSPKDKHYFCTFPKVPELCVHMGTSILADWFPQRFRFLASQLIDEELRSGGLDSNGLLRQLAALTKETGEVADQVGRAVCDEVLDRKELKRVQNEVADVLKECCRLQEKLTRALQEGHKETPEQTRGE